MGWALKARAGKKKVALELGGNAGCIVHSDADLDKAVARCVTGGFAYAGQSCISVQRILVERSVFEEFAGKLTAAAQQLRTRRSVRRAHRRGTDDPAGRRRAGRAVDCRGRGAKAHKVLCGGTRSGSVLAPTVLTGTTEKQRVNCQEIFAPVVTVEAYDDFGEAIARVNRSPYGLQAGVFTRDIGRLLRAYDELEVGAVIGGDVPTFRIDSHALRRSEGLRQRARRHSLCDGGDDGAEAAGDLLAIRGKSQGKARRWPRFFVPSSSQIWRQSRFPVRIWEISGSVTFAQEKSALNSTARASVP